MSHSHMSVGPVSVTVPVELIEDTLAHTKGVTSAHSSRIPTLDPWMGRRPPFLFPRSPLAM
jgi:hypothetical protein